MTNVAYRAGDTVPVEVELPTDLTNAQTVSIRLIDDGERVLDAEATIVDAESGRVAYAWDDGETERHGLYRIEWHVAYTEMAETFPKDASDTIYFYG